MRFLMWFLAYWFGGLALVRYCKLEKEEKRFPLEALKKMFIGISVEDLFMAIIGIPGIIIIVFLGCLLITRVECDDAIDWIKKTCLEASLLTWAISWLFLLLILCLYP